MKAPSDAPSILVISSLDINYPCAGTGGLTGIGVTTDATGGATIGVGAGAEITGDTASGGCGATTEGLSTTAGITAAIAGGIRSAGGGVTTTGSGGAGGIVLSCTSGTFGSFINV